MAKREFAQKSKTQAEKKEVPVSENESSYDDRSAEEMLSYTDELLDEIDALLEPMGVEVVKNFVQQGGQ